MKYFSDEKDMQKWFEPMNKKTKNSTESKSSEKRFNKKAWQRMDHKRKSWYGIEY